MASLQEPLCTQKGGVLLHFVRPTITFLHGKKAIATEPVLKANDLGLKVDKDSCSATKLLEFYFCNLQTRRGSPGRGLETLPHFKIFSETGVTACSPKS